MDSDFSDESDSRSILSCSSPVVRRVDWNETDSSQRHGYLFFRRQDLASRNVSGNFFTKKGKPNIVQLLSQREIAPHRSILNRVMFQKKLHTMKVRLRGKSDETTDSGCVEINQKSIYLGISNDSRFLVELIADVDDFLSLASYFENETSDETTFRLVIHFITPLHLIPCYIIELGQRPLCSVYYVGITSNGSLLVSHSLSSGEHKYFKDEVHTDKMMVDVVLLERKIHFSFQAIMNFDQKKMKATNRSFFRIFKDGILFDTGSEIVALTFSDARPDVAGRSRIIFQLRIKGYADEMISHHINVVQGLRIRNATARRCTSTVSGFEDINYRVSARNRKERIPIYDLQLLNGNGPQNSGEINETLDMSEGDGEQPPELFISESFLCAERVINTVVESVLKKRWQDYKFMGVTSSEAYVVDVKDSVATVLVAGIIELSGVRYIFSRLNIEMDWDLNRPEKISLINMSMREVDWVSATMGKWQPTGVRIRLNADDRFMTNDVIDSLQWLCGLYGGLMLTL